MADVSEFFLLDLVHDEKLKEAANGDLDSITGIKNLHQALLHRLITQPGSLIHRPDYGVGIKDYQNAVGSLATFRKLASVIDEQFRRDFRVEDVRGVDIQQDPVNPGLFKLVVTVSAAGYAELPLTFIPFGGV